MAMLFAATNGHYEVVVFLHQIMKEACTIYALEAACERGHLEIVKYLFEHRTLGSITKAVTMAYCCRHFPIVQFLVDHLPEDAMRVAFKNALESNR